MSSITINDLEKSEGFIDSLTDQEIQNILGGFRLRIGKNFELRIGGEKLTIDINYNP